MSRLNGLLMGANVLLLVWNLLSVSTSTYAQIPPPTAPDGVPFIPVNINPTPVPPMVNINPSGFVPSVEVTRMPEIIVRPPACELGNGFETGVGRSVAGPLKLTFLNIPKDGAVTFENGGASSKVSLNSTSLVGSTIYLRAGQRLEFVSEVLYSGCRPG